MSYTSGTRTWYNHQPAPADLSAYGRPSAIPRLHTDGPDALPIGTPRVPHRDAPRTMTHIGLGFTYIDELYRMRTRSHLYDERDTDAALTDAYTIARRLGGLLADCHTCKATRVVRPDDTHCTICRTEF